MVNFNQCEVWRLTILIRCPLSALRGGEQCDEVAERGEVIDAAGFSAARVVKVRGQGGERPCGC